MNKFEYKKLTPFKWFVLENFPFIEADFDALTEWQLFCKLGKEINKVINSTNTLGTQVETLTDYVSNYFDNLDVQEEINKKLDEMAESGELTNIISDYLNLNGVLPFNTISDMISSDNLIENSTCKTLGNMEFNDGLGRFYKIEKIISVNPAEVDGIKLISLGRDNLYARLIKDYYIDTLENKTKYITPEEFGAIGDGTTDDYPAFQRMIDYVRNNAKIINFTNEASCLNYLPFTFLFTKEYVISKPITFTNTYGLTLRNLKLKASENFDGDYLLGINGVSRETNINECNLNGNLAVNKCLSISDYTLITRINNCQFHRFKLYGFYATSKGHEIIMTNCKINQIEWGETSLNLVQNGTGIYLDTQRYDNYFSNLVINYCKDNAMYIKSGSNWFDQCHFYGGYVAFIGSYNHINNSFFDGSIYKIAGFNYTRGCTFNGDMTHFIEIIDTYENNWQYAQSYLLECIFRNDIQTTTTPIIFLDETWNGKENRLALQCDFNTFYQVTPFNYQSPNVYFPAPWKALKFKGLADNGSVRIGNLLIQWGLVTREQSTSDYVNFPIPFEEYTIAVLLIPTYGQTNSVPFANDITKEHFWSNGVEGTCKWLAIGRMYE